MSKTYIGNRNLGRTTDGGFHVSVNIDGKKLQWLDPEPSQQIINHSPDGFNWGYGGSGPSQLSLGLLYDVTGDKNMSLRYYHEFTWEQVASMPDKWKLEEKDIWKWLGSKVETELFNFIEMLASESQDKKYINLDSDIVSESIINSSIKGSNDLLTEIRRILELRIIKTRRTNNA